jgi:competence protein ComEC
LKAALRLPPLILPFCFLSLGIAAAVSSGIFLPEQLRLSLLLLPLPFFFFSSRHLLPLALSPLLFIAGNLMIQPTIIGDPQQRLALEQKINIPLSVEGVVAARPEFKDGGYRLLIRVDSAKPEDTDEAPFHLNGRLLLRLGSSSRNLYSGDRIRFTGKLRPPRNLGTPGEFDSERFYALKGIVATSFVKSDSDITLLPGSSGPGFQRHFDIMARTIGDFIMKILPGIEGGIMKALLIGDMSDIPQEMKDSYSRTGVNHILSISGFHVGIIALALLQLCFIISRIFPALLLYLNFRRFACIATLPIILYYMFLAGAAPATARSVLMLFVLMVALLLEQETDHVNTLALAAVTLLLINPANLYDISFQLSFLALWGMTVMTPLIMKRFETVDPGWKRNIILFTAASFSAVSITLLPVAFYFQQISVTGIISNFFIVPVLGYGAVVTGFASLPLIFPAPALAGWLLKAAGLLVTLSNFIISALDRIPLLPVFIPSAVDIMIFLTALLLMTVIMDNRAKYALLAAAPLLIILLHQLPEKERDFALRIDFLSVGQGESTLITFSNGERMLIDGGGSLFDKGWDVGRKLLLPVLRRSGVRRIDYLVLSHAHPDHIQGLIAVASELPVGEFWDSGLNGGEDYRKLMAVLEQRGIPTIKYTSGSPLKEISGIRIKCLHPFPEKALYPINDLNETSLVLRLESDRFSALFTGDIGCETEYRLLQKGAYLHSSLLKVAHHGSRYSSYPRFLDAVSPEIALIGAGYNNSFRLPAFETVEKLSERGINTFRTDLDGTVTVIYPKNGGKPIISAFRKAI